jgi:adenylate cyclase
MRVSPGAVASVVILLAAAAAMFAAPGLDARLLDAQFAFMRQHHPQNAANDVVLVGIDDAFVDSIEEPLTLSHHYLGALLQAASAGGASVIALDIALPDKRFDQLYSTSHPGADYHRGLLAGLLAARQGSTLVVAKVWDHDRQRYFEPQIDYAAVLGEAGMATALVCADPDQTVRSYPGPACQPDGTARTLSSAIAAAMGKQQAWSGLIDYQIGAPFSYVPIQQVLALARAGDTARLHALFAGHAVLVGTVQADVDLVGVPVPVAAWMPQARRVPGMLVHAQAVRSMLNGGLVATLPAPAAALGPLLFFLFWLGERTGRKLAMMAGATIFLLVASHFLLAHGTWLAPTAMLVAGWTVTLGRAAWQAWLHFRDKQRLARTFSGYVSPAVLGRILDGSIDPHRAGSTLPVCVLFSDIRGFTALSERLPAEAVVALLNRYFARMTAVVHRHGGTVDKFIGDGMMAFFGAPNTLDQPEQAAFDAACAMHAELAGLNAELEAEGRGTLQIGVGVHTGLAVIGHIGSPERHEYTAIGDTVNIAARLESLCAALGYPVICSETVAARIGFSAQLQALGEHALKGHTGLSVFGWRPTATLAPTAG